MSPNITSQAKIGCLMTPLRTQAFVFLSPDNFVLRTLCQNGEHHRENAATEIHKDRRLSASEMVIRFFAEKMKRGGQFE
jgi:hypothetical protein